MEARWRISAIPLGGYVRFVGDMNAASVPDAEAVAEYPAELQPRLFLNKNVWQRMAVVVAGPLANLLFTFLLLYALLLGYGRYTIAPVIGEVVAGGVAAEAGLLAGDTVTSVDGFTVRGFDGTSLSAERGLYWRNDLAFTLPTQDGPIARKLGRLQTYVAVDIGRIFGREGQITGSLAGMVVGLRAVGGPIGFDLGLGLPIHASRSVEARGVIEGHAVYARATFSF